MKKMFMSTLFAFAVTQGAFALDCQNALTNVEMKECTFANLQKADKALSATYKKLMAKLPDNIAREKLKKSQRAWIAFRDTNAVFNADEARDGTLGGLFRMDTELQMTEQREKELSSNYCFSQFNP